MATRSDKYKHYGKRKRADNYFPAFLLDSLRLNSFAQATESLSAGDLVYVYGSDNANLFTGLASAAAGGNPAVGFVDKDYEAGDEAIVIMTLTLNESLSGLVQNTTYFLSDTTPGGITDTMVQGTGKIHQIIGKGIAPTKMFIELGAPIILA